MATSRAAIALLLCLVPAQAQALEQLTASVSLYTPGGQVHDHVQRAGTPGERLPRDSRVEAGTSQSFRIDNFPADDVGAASGRASAGFGWLRAQSVARHNWFQVGAPDGTNAYAAASFSDILTIHHGSPGSTGTATFAFRLTGLVNEDYGANSLIQLQSTIGVTFQTSATILDSASPNARHWVWISIEEAFPPLIDDWLAVSLRYWVGMPFEISLRLGCQSGIAHGPKVDTGFGFGLTACDAGHTLSWGGLVGATDESGAPIRVAISSLSGTDYARAIAAPRLPGAVPEPATWALMLAGFGLAGAAVRRRLPTTA